MRIRGPWLPPLWAGVGLLLCHLACRTAVGPSVRPPALGLSCPGTSHLLCLHSVWPRGTGLSVRVACFPGWGPAVLWASRHHHLVPQGDSPGATYHVPSADLAVPPFSFQPRVTVPSGVSAAHSRLLCPASCHLTLIHGQQLQFSLREVSFDSPCRHPAVFRVRLLHVPVLRLRAPICFVFIHESLSRTWEASPPDRQTPGAAANLLPPATAPGLGFDPVPHPAAGPTRPWKSSSRFCASARLSAGGRGRAGRPPLRAVPPARR